MTTKKVIDYINESYGGISIPNEEGLHFKQPKEYVIDFDKVSSIEDIISILKGLNIRYYDHEENIPKEMMYYLKESGE